MRLARIEAGEIVTTHGLRGEVKVLPWLDGPEALCDLKRCCIGGKEYRITQCRVQKTCCLVKLEGVDSVEAGQALRGKTLEAFREDFPGDLIFAAELQDMEVYCDGALLGKIEDVLDYPGNQVYVVRGEHEYLIPAVSAFVKSTSLEENRMEVNVIAGMRSDED